MQNFLTGPATAPEGKRSYCGQFTSNYTAERAIPYGAEGEDEPQANAQTYRLRVEETGTLTVSALTDYLTSTNVNTAYTDKVPVLQALNIYLGHYAKSSPTVTTVGSSKSFSISQASPKWDLGAGLSALRGFFSSIRVATCRILVNVNVSRGAFYDAIPLDQLIQKYGSANQFNRVKLQSFLSASQDNPSSGEGKQNRQCCSESENHLWPCKQRRRPWSGSSTAGAEFWCRTEGCRILP